LQYSHRLFLQFAVTEKTLSGFYMSVVNFLLSLPKKLPFYLQLLRSDKVEEAYKEEITMKLVPFYYETDRIAELDKIVEALPEVHFSVAALTEMSSRLMSMDKYSNVSLYPGVKMKVLEELFLKADFYLDINHETEIVSAVEKAFLHNHLIFAFQETLHNPSYVAKEHIFTVAKVNELILALKAVLSSTSLLKEYLERQKHVAMLETEDRYLEL